MPNFDDYAKSMEIKPDVRIEQYLSPEYRSSVAYASKEADKDNRIADIKNGQFKGIYDALSAAGIEADEEKYKRYGSYITQGIANGIVTDTDTLEKAMNILATSGEEAFKEALQIYSPSKVFEELGGYVTQGLALGISDGEADVDEAVDNIAAGMASRMPYDKNDTGYAWSGAKEMYANSQPSDNSVTVGDTNVTVEIDGEELANYVVRVQGRQVVMSNGR